MQGGLEPVKFPGKIIARCQITRIHDNQIFRSLDGILFETYDNISDHAMR
jgi:hypothetical protein